MSDLPGQSTGTTGAPPGGGQPGYQPQPMHTGSGPSGPRSGFWRRFGALIIDGILLGIVQGILTAALSDSMGVVYLLTTVINWVYYTYFEGGTRGQTVGKMALSIRVVDIDTAQPIGYGRAFIRQIVKIISAIPLFLGYFWMLWDKEKQCWHDKAARDVVVPIDAYPVQ